MITHNGMHIRARLFCY